MDKKAEYNRTEYTIMIAAVLFTCLIVLMFANDMSYTGFVARERIKPVINQTIVNETNQTTSLNETANEAGTETPRVEKPAKVDSVQEKPEIKTQAGCIEPYEDMIISSDTVLCSGTYPISDSDADGALQIGSSNLEVTCNDTLLKGSNSSDSMAVSIGAYSNITFNNCSFTSYAYCYRINTASADDITIIGGACYQYKSISTTTLNKTYGIYTKASNLRVNHFLIQGYESSPRIGAYDSYWRGVGIELATGYAEYNFRFNNITIRYLATGISVNGVPALYGGTAINTTIENSLLHNFTSFGAISAPLRNAIVRNNNISLAGTDSIRVHGNNSLVYNNTFDTAGHKRGIDSINNGSRYTAGYNHTWYGNTFTSSRTNINTKTWISPSYTDCSRLNYIWCFNNDGDITVAIRGVSDVYSHSNRFVNIEDNDTNSGSTAGYGIDLGDYSRNILLYNDTFINVSGVMWYIIGKNITVKNSYICKSTTGNTKYPYDLLGAGDYGSGSNNITTITIINNTKCPQNSNLTYLFAQNNRTNMTIYQNSSYIIQADTSAGRGGYYTLYAQGDYNDIYDGITGALIQANFTKYTGFLSSGQKRYITNTDTNPPAPSESTPPIITVYSPVGEETYYGLSVLINISATDDSGIDSIWYWNGSAYKTYNAEEYLQLTTYGSKAIRIYANDSYNNIANINVTFSTASSLSLTGISLVDSLNCSATVNRLSNITVDYYLDDSINNTLTYEANNSFSSTTQRFNGTWYCNVTANDGMNTTRAKSGIIIINETTNDTGNESINDTNITYVPVELTGISLADSLNCSASINKLANITMDYYLDGTLNNTLTYEANNSFSSTTQRFNGTWYCNVTANDGMNTTLAGSNTVLINEIDEEKRSGSRGGSGSSGSAPPQSNTSESHSSEKNESVLNESKLNESLQNTGPDKAVDEPIINEQEIIQEPIIEQPAIISSTIWERNKSIYIPSIIIFIIATIIIILNAKPIRSDLRIEQYTIKALQSGYSYDAVRNVLKRHIPQAVIDHHFHILRRHDVRPLIRFKKPVERELFNEESYISRLREYIIHQRSTGFKDKHIKKVLLTNGYPKSVVEKAFGKV